MRFFSAELPTSTVWLSPVIEYYNWHSLQFLIPCSLTILTIIIVHEFVYNTTWPNPNKLPQLAMMVSSDPCRPRPRRRRRRTVKVQDFSSLESPHPYGILPGGNRFFLNDDVGDDSSSSVVATRDKKKKFEQEQDIFNDDVWQHILGFCDGTTLARVVQSSRYLYVAGHQPELWRDLVLRLCSSQQKKKKTISQVANCWKDTFVMNQCSSHGVSATGQYVPHQPMSIPGIYSDTYYRSHICRSFAIPPSWLEEDEEGMDAPSIMEIPGVPVDEMTPEKFFDDYEQSNQPVVIKGAVKDTQAVKRWKDYDYLSQRQPKGSVCEGKSNSPMISFRATSGAAPLPGNFSLDAYREYCHYPYLEESPLYLFDRTAFTTKTTTTTTTTSSSSSDDDESWANDFFPEFYSKCPYWDPAGTYGHDLLQYLGCQQRPDHTWLIIGPKRSGSVFHIDPNATHAWNACIVGRKRWIFYPPGCTPPGVHPSDDGDEVAIPLSVGEWLTQYWTEHMRRYKQQPDQRPMECTTHPGDVIFVPHGWWHCVINLDGPYNVAITHNYVSKSNLGNVLHFFQDKIDQISGCRDRVESIKPEHLYEKFTKALESRFAEALDKAKSQKGWTCAAWDSDIKKHGLDKVEEDKNVVSDGENSTANNQHHRRCVPRNRKRPYPAPSGDRALCNDENPAEKSPTGMKSVMAKADNIPAFSFSFL